MKEFSYFISHLRVDGCVEYIPALNILRFARLQNNITEITTNAGVIFRQSTPEQLESRLNNFLYDFTRFSQGH